MPQDGTLKIKVMDGAVNVDPPPGHASLCGSRLANLVHIGQSQSSDDDGMLILTDAIFSPGTYTFPLQMVWDAYGGMTAPQRLWLHNPALGMPEGGFYHDILVADAFFITNEVTVTLTEANKTTGILGFWDGWIIYYRMGDPSVSFPPPRPARTIDLDDEYARVAVPHTGGACVAPVDPGESWGDDQGNTSETWNAPGFPGAVFDDITVTMRCSLTDGSPSSPGKYYYVNILAKKYPFGSDYSWSGPEVSIEEKVWTLGEALPPITVPGEKLTEAWAASTTGDVRFSINVHGEYNQGTYWQWDDDDPLPVLTYTSYTGGGGGQQGSVWKFAGLTNPGGGTLNVKAFASDGSGYVPQSVCQGTWLDPWGGSYPFWTTDNGPPSVMIGPNGARVRWPSGEVFGSSIAGWARLYVEVAASTTITWSAMYAGGVSVPINEWGDDRWWNQYPPTHLGPYNIRSVSPGAQTIVFPNDADPLGAFFSNGGINAIGFDGFDLSWDTPGAVTRVCVAEFGEIG